MLVARMMACPEPARVSLLPDTVLGRCQMLIILLWNDEFIRKLIPKMLSFY